MANVLKNECTMRKRTEFVQVPGRCMVQVELDILHDVDEITEWFHKENLKEVCELLQNPLVQRVAESETWNQRLRRRKKKGQGEGKDKKTSATKPEILTGLSVKISYSFQKRKFLHSIVCNRAKKGSNYFSLPLFEDKVLLCVCRLGGQQNAKDQEPETCVSSVRPQTSGYFSGAAPCSDQSDHHLTLKRIGMKKPKGKASTGRLHKTSKTSTRPQAEASVSTRGKELNLQDLEENISQRTIDRFLQLDLPGGDGQRGPVSVTAALHHTSGDLELSDPDGVDCNADASRASRTRGDVGSRARATRRFRKSGTAAMSVGEAELHGDAAPRDDSRGGDGRNSLSDGTTDSDLSTTIDPRRGAPRAEDNPPSVASKSKGQSNRQRQKKKKRVKGFHEADDVDFVHSLATTTRTLRNQCSQSLPQDKASHNEEPIARSKTTRGKSKKAKNSLKSSKRKRIPDIYISDSDSEEVVTPPVALPRKRKFFSHKENSVFDFDKTKVELFDNVCGILELPKKRVVQDRVGSNPDKVHKQCLTQLSSRSGTDNECDDARFPTRVGGTRSGTDSRASDAKDSDTAPEPEDLFSDCYIQHELSTWPTWPLIVEDSSTEKIKSEIKALKNHIQDLREEHLRFLIEQNTRYLRDIFQGKSEPECLRHQAYKAGGKRRAGLEWNISFGVFTEKQSDYILELLLGVFCKKHHKYFDYVMKVMLPEILVKIYIDVLDVTYGEAETAMTRLGRRL